MNKDADKTTSILFVCHDDGLLAHFAASYINTFCNNYVRAYCGDSSSLSGVGNAKLVFERFGVDVYAVCVQGEGKRSHGEYDIIITLVTEEQTNKQSKEKDSNVFGEIALRPLAEKLISFVLPVSLIWKVDMASESSNGMQSMPDLLGGLCCSVKNKIDNFFRLGFFDVLRKQREQFFAVLDEISEGVLIHDDKRQIFYCNKAAISILGKEWHEMIGHDCHSLFHGGGICGAHCCFRKQKQTIGQKSVYCNRFISHDGIQKEFQIKVSPLAFAGQERPGALIILSDITEVEHLRWKMEENYSLHGFITRSEKSREVVEVVRRVSDSDYPVMLMGETGTGKEMVARAIHYESSRCQAPFVSINCGALPEHILESELFGHVRGAFTGAHRNKKGVFEQAHAGTLFLDEICELPLKDQVKLLRVLQDMQFTRIGGEEVVQVDVRVICATNQDIMKMVKEGAFREDLYYRLHVVPISLAPLRERCEDIPLLVEHYLSKINKQHQDKTEKKVANETMAVFMKYSWPGNVRELINTLQYCFVICKGNTIKPMHLPVQLLNDLQESAQNRSGSVDKESLNLNGKTKRTKILKSDIEYALAHADNNRVAAAKYLGISRANFYRYLKQFNIK